MGKETVIDGRMLTSLSEEAGSRERGRANLNLHASLDEPCQRLLNAVQPGTYVRPHRHTVPPKPETFIMLRGRMAVILFDDLGEIERLVELSAGSEVVGLDVPAGAWHSLVCLEAGSVFFETKPGPYEPISDKDWAPWAPEEGSSEAKEYLSCLELSVRSQL